MRFLATSADTSGAFAMHQARSRQERSRISAHVIDMPSLWRKRDWSRVTAFNRALSPGTGCTRSSATNPSHSVYHTGWINAWSDDQLFWTFERRGWILPG